MGYSSYELGRRTSISAGSTLSKTLRAEHEYRFEWIASCTGTLERTADWLAEICELKIDVGPGYRVYYIERRDELVLLLGGDKRTQRRDIRKALALAKGT